MGCGSTNAITRATPKNSTTIMRFTSRRAAGEVCSKSWPNKFGLPKYQALCLASGIFNGVAPAAMKPARPPTPGLVAHTHCDSGHFLAIRRKCFVIIFRPTWCRGHFKDICGGRQVGVRRVDCQLIVNTNEA